MYLQVNRQAKRLCALRTAEGFSLFTTKHLKKDIINPYIYNSVASIINHFIFKAFIFWGKMKVSLVFEN
jgi:hypothetical protein